MASIVLFAGYTPLLAAGTNPAVTLPHGRELAHPVVSGAAGPFSQVKLTLTRAPSEIAGVFTGSLDTGDGPELILEGPSEPPDFFLFDVKAVLFTPIEMDGRCLIELDSEWALTTMT